MGTGAVWRGAKLPIGVDEGIGEQMGTHVGKEVRERMLEVLDEATLPFRLSRKAGVKDGWLRVVRLAVGTTVEELACRLGASALSESDPGLLSRSDPPGL